MASSQSASRLVTRSASNPVRAMKSSISGRCGRTWETPTWRVALVAYMSITGRLREAADAGVDPSVVFVAICQHYRSQLVDTDYAAGCPIGAAMQEAHHDADLGPVVNGIVSDWQTALADLLAGSGRAQREADDLAVLANSSLEGAIMMARVTRSTAPMDVVVDRIAPLLAAE
jgi:TetR/AcrR family transcriptional regulator, lmrAB and yxaGH operons repressor